MHSGLHRTIDVLIVDDSGFMRLAIQKMLVNDPSLRIVGEASTGEEAVRLAELLKPDVITMDLEMPGMGGLDATQAIMRRAPVPIIVVSSLTTHGAAMTFRALATGAVDYVPKSSSFVDLDIVHIENQLLEKIHYWAAKGSLTLLKRNAADAGPASIPLPRSSISLQAPERPVGIVVIGASTGGPRVLPELLASTGKLRCPIVIALHMPPLYTESFAAHVASYTGLTVVEGKHMQVPEPGQVIVAPGGTDTVLQFALSGKCRLKVGTACEDAAIHPSVDALFSSAAEVCKGPVGVVLTGMGEDGLQGSRAMVARDYPVLVQDEVSSVVYGMPKAVANAGLAMAELNIEQIAATLKKWAGDAP